MKFSKLILPVLACGMLFTSCDMDTMPKNAIPEDEALETVDDFRAFRNNFYNSLRGITTGSYVSTEAMQGDMFVGLIVNGNRLGNISNGNILSNNGDTYGLFGAMYGSIRNVNYFLPRAEAMLNADLDSEEDYAQMRRYIGEAKFLRAYCNYFLLDHFCQSYTPEIGDTPALGVPLQMVYNPTSDSSVYPGRSTLNETFAAIEKDLDDCYTALADFEENYGDIANTEMLVRNAAYLSTYAVKAFQARLALLKCDYQKAYDLSKEIVDSKKYPLCIIMAYANLWKSDVGNEVIFRPYANKDEAGGLGSTGSAWLSVYDRCDYVATENALSIYDENDIRYTTFFTPEVINVFSVEVTVPSFTKYPGNSSLNIVANANTFKNMPKMFRTSELVLIMAEAADKLGKTAEANDALNELRKVRIKNWDATTTYTGQELTHEIRLERTRELMGEGFRISDLRRWKQGFTRSVDYSAYPQYEDVPGVTVVASREVSYTDNDHRYVWPIPANELQTNPQLAGQQNPGY